MGDRWMGGEGVVYMIVVRVVLWVGDLWRNEGNLWMNEGRKRVVGDR